MRKEIQPAKVTKKTTGDQDAESIIDYYMKVGILKVPSEYKLGDSITTDWYNELDAKERERIWKDAGDAWWKAYGLHTWDEYYLDEVVVNHQEGDIVEWFNKKIYTELKDFDKKLEKDIVKKYKTKRKKINKKKLPRNKMKMK